MCVCLIQNIYTELRLSYIVVDNGNRKQYNEN